MKPRFKELNQFIQDAQKKGNPQVLQIQVVQNGKQVLKKHYGKNYRYFDVASLTKIMTTTPLLMKLYDTGAFKLDDPISKYLEFLKSTALEKISIKKLLAHNSGLVWWRPYYKKLLKFSNGLRKSQLKNLIRSEKTRSTRSCVYSDPDYFLLGWLVEELYGMPLEEASNLYIFEPLGLKNTSFRCLKKSEAAPTGRTKLRGLIQGVVHDDNTWSLGGVSSHAGVFSTLEDVTTYGLSLLDHVNSESSFLFRPKTARIFTSRAVPRNVGDWGLGFMIPSRPISSGGGLINEHAFGHTGFTGTSLWIDVKRQAVVTVLSNRTMPESRDERFLKLRREIHDAVWRVLGE